jgi:hypothetical protein
MPVVVLGPVLALVLVLVGAPVEPSLEPPLSADVPPSPQPIAISTIGPIHRAVQVIPER